ncbi:MAG: AMP-binding protein [Candidatus Hydrogenedentes bacterium]|nr:AMP-binding protein [Candidatus Hydrogenedentota bacterium]
MDAGVQLGDIFVSHAELMVRAAKVAHGLDALGVKRKDAVAIMLRNDIAFLETSIAVRMLGGYPVPMNWHLAPDEAAYILSDCGAKVLIAHDELLHAMGTSVPDSLTQLIVVPTPEYVATAYGLDTASLPVPEGAIAYEAWRDEQEPWDQAPPTETASMIYTSGTTGQPKGVRREEATPEQYQQTVMAVGSILGVQPGTRTVIPAPLYHSAPNAYAQYAVLLENFMVIQARFDAEELLQLIERYKVTRLQMVPTMFVRLLKLPEAVRNRYDVSSLEYVIHAAAPCPPKIKKAMIDWWGPIINEYYGSTEMSAVTLATAQDALAKPGTVGKPVPGATVKILNEDGTERAAGEIGTVYGKVDYVTDFTYAGDDEKRKSIEMNGLITCGDVGYFDADGYLFLCDRATDMIISGGVNIYPAEIEAVLIECEGVRDCAVFGIPSDDFGESVCAVIELEEGAELSAEDIQAYLGERIARYKVPRTVEFRTDLPREDSGKLFKRKLRQPYWDKAGRSI